ncbi:GH25 family lysozyme [Streptomyces sp. IBSNAI002]|uniref:GH25 family lysozyme n=1 Tax=Streptomyces sp. IBSNAI002 TaxID=3457500 RepID=UPI003FCEF82D
MALVAVTLATGPAWADPGGQGGRARSAPTGVEGVDVASYQGRDVPWPAMAKAGVRFAYVKATEGTGYENPHRAAQVAGARKAGLLVGAYHFARPDLSNGAAQARYFLSNGGRWSADGRTLPGVLDLEASEGGDGCYDREPAELRWWTKRFLETYKAATGKDAVIYTSTSWWNRCMGSGTQFRDNPLWTARYNTSTAGELPGAWNEHQIWQYTAKGSFKGAPGPYDRNRFNGTEGELRALTRAGR